MYDNRWMFSLCRVVRLPKVGMHSYVSCLYHMTSTQRCLTCSSSPLQCLQAEAYTGGTTVPIPDDLHQSAPPNFSQSRLPMFVFDDVVLPQNGDGRLQHLSDKQSNSGECCMLK